MPKNRYLTCNKDPLFVADVPQTSKNSGEEEGHKWIEMKQPGSSTVSLSWTSFYVAALLDRGHIVLPVSVCPSVCLFICLSAENLTCDFNIFL